MKLNFTWVDKEQIRQDLRKNGAKLIQAETLFRVIVYNFDDKTKTPDGYLRLRDEGSKITLSIKASAKAGGKMSDQKEINTVVADFDDTKKLLENLGYTIWSYREKYRETWILNNSEVVIDAVPGLPTYCEVGAEDEKTVWDTAKILNLDKLKNTITGIDDLYMQEYNLSEEEFEKTCSIITFQDYPNWLKI